MSVRKADNPELFAKVQEKNLLRQYDLLLNCVEIGLEKGIEAFDKYTLWSLNAAAVANIAQLGGRYRQGPIYVGNHRPPHFKEVPHEIDNLISIVHENWTVFPDPMTLPAYALWRLNWVHPFVEGNGRTARAACYYLICMKAGGLYEVRRSFQSGFEKIESPIMKPCETPIDTGMRVTLMSANSRLISVTC